MISFQNLYKALGSINKNSSKERKCISCGKKFKSQNYSDKICHTCNTIDVRVAYKKEKLLRNSN